MTQKLKNVWITDMMSYRLMFAFCFVVHLLLLVVFAYFDIVLLAVFNIGSVVFYITGSFCLHKTKDVRVWLFSMFAELVVHVTMCNLILGWGFGFSMYGILVVPITFYNSYSDEEGAGGYPLWSAVLLALIDCALVMTSLLNTGMDNGSIVSALPVIKYIFIGNCTISMIAIVMYTLLFYMRVRNSREVMREQREELIYVANHDKLTKLRNRTSSAEIFHKMEESREQYCIAIGDIDDFKMVNDTYGHNIGDEVLMQVARVIKQNVPGEGNTFRWGGEEFLVLLPVPKEEMVRQIEQIRCQIEKLEFASGLTKFGVTMTFGVAENHALMSCHQVVSSADRRLYVGKRSGKNQVVSK